jgi:hypothetical protein
MRKSPIKHKVSSYIRDSKQVHSYLRGHGTKPFIHLSNPNKFQKPKGYTVTFVYTKAVLNNHNIHTTHKDIEELKVIATSYQRAVTEAFRNRQDKRTPLEINVVDPSISEVARWAGQHALDFGKAVAKESYHTGKNLYSNVTNIALEHTAQGKGLSSAIAKKQLEQRHDSAVQRLIKDSYSSDPSVKTFARSKLKKEHPEVYHVLDVSTSKTE